MAACDYGELPEVDPSWKLCTSEYHRHPKYFIQESRKWVDATKLNTRKVHDKNDVALVGISRDTGRWGIIEIIHRLG